MSRPPLPAPALQSTPRSPSSPVWPCCPPPPSPGCHVSWKPWGCAYHAQASRTPPAVGSHLGVDVCPPVPRTEAPPSSLCAALPSGPPAHPPDRPGWDYGLRRAGRGRARLAWERQSARSGPAGGLREAGPLGPAWGSGEAWVLHLPGPPPSLPSPDGMDSSPRLQGAAVAGGQVPCWVVAVGSWAPGCLWVPPGDEVGSWAPSRPLSAAQLWPQEAAVSLCRAVSPPDPVITERGDGVEQHPMGARPLTCQPGGLGGHRATRPTERGTQQVLSKRCSEQPRRLPNPVPSLPGTRPQPARTPTPCPAPPHWPIKSPPWGSSSNSRGPCPPGGPGAWRGVPRAGGKLGAGASLKR